MASMRKVDSLKNKLIKEKKRRKNYKKNYE